MDIAASLSEGPLLRAAGSCIRIAPESRGMHQAVIVEADISLPWAMRNASSLDVLSVFLIPGGMYIDEYEMQVGIYLETATILRSLPPFCRRLLFIFASKNEHKNC